LELLSWKGVGFCQRFFLCLWKDHVVFVLASIMYYITFMDLHILNHPCIPGMKLTWSWCMIFFIHFWFLFASILLSILACVFINDIGLQFSFLVMSLLGFRMTAMLAS
jgi:hypothetical protein